MTDTFSLSSAPTLPQKAPEECVEWNDLLEQYAALHTQTVGGLVDLMARMRSGSECFKNAEVQQDTTYLAELRGAVAKHTDPSDPLRAHLRRLSPDDFTQHRYSLRTYRSILIDAVGSPDADTLLAIAISHEAGTTAEEKMTSLESRLQSAGARIIHGMPLMTERGVVWGPFRLVHIPGQSDLRLSIADQARACARELKSGMLQTSQEADALRSTIASYTETGI